MKFVFAGDVFLGGDLLFKAAGNPINVPGFNNADFRIVNLEQAISDREHLERKGTLHTPSLSVERLKAMHVDVASLANNHIHDKGAEGIVETVRHISAVGIQTLGADCEIGLARRPVQLDETLYLLSYLDSTPAYLTQVCIATADAPGAAPLDERAIWRDLECLPERAQAVLFFHWGREHVWLPPGRDVRLAQRLLDDDRVALIIGMHAHRPQGIVDHGGKRAYMCVGNFLFPNFFISPPCQLTYPTEDVTSLTRQYHTVNDVTYKMWRRVNRVSMLVHFDSRTRKVTHEFVIQRDREPEVNSVSRPARYALEAWIRLLSATYRTGPRAYAILERATGRLQGMTWRCGVLMFRLRQLGVRRFLRRAWARDSVKDPNL